VAHALVRAVSRLFSTPACVRYAERRQECRRGTHECVRHAEMAQLFLDEPLALHLGHWKVEAADRSVSAALAENPAAR
jgi:hypothetical protein